MYFEFCVDAEFCEGAEFCLDVKLRVQIKLLFVHCAGKIIK